MHLKKIEMKGFKSFAQRAELHFDKGITAVVGPNGCGKSNIADAIRWVLGEQSARSLRGQKMEDIIFSGTDRKKPQGLAEVTIVFDNNSALLPIPYQEVAITRRVYRSGESEYYLNRTKCRLKDVRELLMDTGIGKEGYSIIGQGRIDELLSQRGDERRLLFDEAAGIVKYRTRKEEAAKKMGQTDENLSRLKDILLELEEQIEPLKKQADKAEKYLMLREKVALLEVDAFIREYDKTKGAMTQIEREQEEWENNLHSIHQDLENVEEEEQKAVIYIEQCQQEKDTLDQRIRDIENRTEETRTLRRLKEQARDHLGEQRHRLKTDALAMQQESEKETARFLQLEQAMMQHQELILEKNEKLSALKERIVVETQQLKSRHELLEDNKAGIIETLNDIAGLKARKERIQALQDAAAERHRQLEAELDRVRQTTTVAKEQYESLMKQKMSIKQHVEKLKEEIQQQQEFVKQKEEHITSLERDIYSTSQEHDRSLHRKNTLVNMEKSFEGFQRGVKNVLRAVQQQPHLSQGFHGVVADLIRVPKGYETAVETALGPALQYLVTDEEAQAKKIIEYLKKNHQGRVTILPINVIKGRQLRNQELQSLEKYPNTTCALDRISYPSPYQSIFENLLGRVIIAGQLDTAIQIARDFRHQIKITTLDGDLIQPGGSMTGGSVSHQQDGLLVRKREIEELGNQIHELAAKRNDLETRREQLMEDQGRLMSLLHERKQELSQEEQTAVRVESDSQGFARQLEEQRHQQQRLEDEKKQLSLHIGDLISDTQHLHNKLTEKEKTLADVRADVEKEATTQRLMQQQMEQLSQLLNQLQVEIAEHNEKGKSLATERTASEDRLQMISKKQKTMDQEAQSIDEREAAISKEMEVLAVSIQQLLETIEEEQKKEQQLKKMKEDKQQALKGLREDIQQLKETLEGIREKMHQAEIRLSKQEWQLQQVEEKLLEQHQFNPTQARIWLKSHSEHGLKPSDLNAFKREMLSLGDVHVGALDEYKRVKERFDFLIKQQQDMLDAKESLERIISELETHMIQQFREQFDKIQVRFNEVFQRLFHGGNTELVLQNPEDLLTTGIEIIAQPPGKKSQHLSLLSGGEKALTAISLLFGILLVKPSPFCVLDEIEAALDDANVSRFADYLVTLSSEIQFVVVTHKKQTMERAQTLYGITMQEKGISKMLTLKLQEIEENMIAG
ncbi:MAG: chromosome segregation protein SMC [Bacillota bacterium]|nr:chromosome segregation protein SMC [Bacillota bacterium]MDW7676085.1 chromosome segregation protein SMC [Bacillota bacterium]